MADEDGKFWVLRTSDGILVYSEEYRKAYRTVFFEGKFRELKIPNYREISISNTGVVIIETRDEIQVWEVLP